jgi:alpha-beta hydrolase superfamily lysophospholipase/SAM-dependent methyltransferase
VRTPQERHFATDDGTELFYRYWPAAQNTTDKAVVLFHRGHEHSGRMAHLVDELRLPEFASFAWDARGHGRSPGPRGHSPSLATSVKDVDNFVAHVSRAHGIPLENIAVIAQSVGAVLVATWAHDFAPHVRCLVLASPAFKVKLYVPFARPGLQLLQKLRGNFFVNSYVKAKFLTHDPERIASYQRDPLITRPISVNILLALYAAAERVVADARAITLPTQLLISGSDWVVHRAPQERFFERLGAPIKERHVLPGFYHDTLGEKDRALAVDKARDFVLRMFAQAPQRVSLLDAHRSGYTREEQLALERPLPALAPKAIGYALMRAGMGTLGRLSDGMRLGFETGFDSGSTLDYVYRNEAKGRLALGKRLDRNYLDSIGWRGIRVRKAHIETLIARAMEALRTRGTIVRVLDIAAGHGRYVLESLERSPVKPDSILLRDYSDINVRDGAALIREKGLAGIARFERGDAFDAASLAAIAPRPTLAIVSGLYELFADNALAERSLSGLSRCVEPGGYLVYTGQPWHPAARADRAHAHQSPRPHALGDAPAHSGRDGSARRGSRLPQA